MRDLALSVLLLLAGAVAGSPAAQDRMADRLTLEHYPLVPLRSDLGEVLVDRERELVLDAMEAVREVIELRAKDPKNLGRGDHAKTLGCYPATFTVAPADIVGVELQAGVARRENLGRTFAAVVRLSNSEPKDIPDYRSATTGLALKVALDPATHPTADFLFESATSQDFVAGGLDTFIARNVADYAELFRLRIHPITNALKLKRGHPEAFSVFGTEPLFRVVRPGAMPIVLETRFSSLLPYAWGDAAVKFRFEPCHAFHRSQASFSRFDGGYQRKIVTDFLATNDLCYTMLVQTRPRAGSDDERRALERTFPVEDAMVRWPDSAPFREVARVVVKRGSAPLEESACERMAFNPWNGLKAHQPLGSLNRARLAVYTKSALVRNELERATERR